MNVIITVIQLTSGQSPTRLRFEISIGLFILYNFKGVVYHDSFGNCLLDIVISLLLPSNRLLN